MLTTKLIRHRCPATSVPTLPSHAGSSAFAEFRSEPFLSMSESYIGGDVVMQHGAFTCIAYCLNLLEDNLAIPDILCQAYVDVIHKRFQLNHFMAGLSSWRFRVFEVASDGPFRATNLSLDNVRALLAHLLYHVKFLSAQHVDVLSGVRTLRKQHVGWSG